MHKRVFLFHVFGENMCTFNRLLQYTPMMHKKCSIGGAEPEPGQRGAASL
jgi:hypothetical protein